jgi:sn-glycerol 3-phosphate transport system permease protein
MAATMIIVAPLLIAFLFFQRQFIRSFLYSGLK